MNSDEIKNALTQVGTAVLALLTAYGVVDAGTAHNITTTITTVFTSLSALIPAILTLVSIGISIWQHWNQKKVPETAVVVPGSGGSNYKP